ncbi:MAG: asparagine synthase (glutamine-hydrolyzing) [Alphaproteobacteria bacterium]
MCGIAGTLKFDQSAPDKAGLERAQAALARRGPDGCGIHIAGNVGLVHTRLSIVDLAAGAQPMTGRFGVTIVFNGEIYNDPELRDMLAQNYPYQTQSDTESILALYQAKGADFPKYLRGMYAVALYDPRHERLILARDPFGIKPFYIEESSEALSFASEIKAIHALRSQSQTQAPSPSPSQSCAPDPAKLRGWLAKGYLQQGDVPYQGLSKLKPGEVRVYEKNRLTAQYWIESLQKHEGSQERDYKSADPQKALEDLEAQLLDSVQKHTRSDVGYGVFLSGGVDSTSLCVALKKLGVEAVQTYTAAFDVAAAKDEREIAQKTAKAMGFAYNEILVREADFWENLPLIAAYMDDPVADYAIIPTWLLARRAAQSERVVLCGEGGDEMLAGYGRYKPRFWKDWRAVFRDDPHRSSYHAAWTSLQKKQAKDIWTYLPNDLLVKLDICLMAHGLEGRTPYLDQDFSPFAFHLPDGLKRQGKHGKYLLKKWLSREFPDYPAFAKKQGFTVPVGAWIDNRRSEVLAMITGSALMRELLSREELSAVSSLPSKNLWPLLYLAHWASTRY